MPIAMGLYSSSSRASGSVVCLLTWLCSVDSFCSRVFVLLVTSLPSKACSRTSFLLVGGQAISIYLVGVEFMSGLIGLVV